MAHAYPDGGSTLYVPEEQCGAVAPEEFYYAPDGQPTTGVRLVGPGGSIVVDIDAD